jgi:cell division protein FtsB
MPTRPRGGNPWRRHGPHPPGWNPRRRRSPLAGLLGGTRAYIVAIGVLVVLLVSMTIGPLEIFGAQADRVDLLTAQRDQLAGEVDALRQRREQLQDPREIEELARREQGLVRPGEVPYVVVTPTPEPVPPVPGPEQDESFLRRLTRSLTELFR